MRTTVACGCIVLLTLVAGCRGELQQDPGNLQVTLTIQGGKVELVDLAEVDATPNAPVGGDAIRFRFQPLDGGAAVDGEVRDSRILRSEFDLEGRPDPQRVVAGAGILSVRIPNTPGTLSLFDADGESLGTVDVDPDGPRTRTAALMRADDVVGSPIKVVNHGSSSQRVDILFLPEGYTQAELPRFHAHVDAIVAQMQTHPGYREHWAGFNVWRQDVRSRVSGTGIAGRPKDTAFDTAAGISGLERCVFFANPAGARAALQLADDMGADTTVVLVNSTEYGGCAGDDVVVSARPLWVADIVSHELGHSLFGLADEYEFSRPSGSCTVGPNVWFSARAEDLPWGDMLTTNELPTPSSASFGTIGAFEGGGYCARGRYRPTHNCMMRTLGTGLCPVCQREVARTMAALAPGSVNSATRVAVTNETGAPIWVRCDGPVRADCSDWTYLEDRQSGDVFAPSRRLVLHNEGLGGSITFQFAKVAAPGAQVTLHANAVDPFTPAAAPDDDGPAVSSNPAEPAHVAPAIPASLTPPNEAVVAPGIHTLSWAGAATSYGVVVQEYDATAGTWTQLFKQSAWNGTSIDAVLDMPNTWYSWRVQGCNGAECSEWTQDMLVRTTQP